MLPTLQITDTILCVDLSLVLPEQKILIIADLHLGLEESYRKQGIFLPKTHTTEVLARIQKILEHVQPKHIIINGDLKHEFGRILDEEWRDVRKLVDMMAAYGDITLIKGNHDAILAPMARALHLRLVDHVFIDDIYITHGDKIPTDSDFKRAKTVIIGHEHPALALRDGGRVERFKCFLSGTWKQQRQEKKLIVMPSMNQFSEGTDMLSEKRLSPFLKKIDDFNVFIVGDELLPFGTIASVMKAHPPERRY